MSAEGPSPLLRRTVLTGGAVAGIATVLTGCSGRTPVERAAHASTAQRLRRAATTEHRDLVASYRATVEAHPRLSSALTPFQRVAEARLSVLAEHPAGENEQDTSETAASPPPAPHVPAEPDAALEALADAEQRIAEVRFRSVGEAPPELARLLASLAAGCSAQAYLLNEVRT